MPVSPKPCSEQDLPCHDHLEEASSGTLEEKMSGPDIGGEDVGSPLGVSGGVLILRYRFTLDTVTGCFLDRLEVWGLVPTLGHKACLTKALL